MEKERFLSLTKNYTSLSAEEALELTSLLAAFPYSQLIHNLTARATRDNDLDSQEASLHLSAVYATDRAVLKAIMTSPRSVRKAGTEDKPAIPVAQVSAKESMTKPSPAPAPGLSTDEWFAEITHDLERLQELKHNFENIYVSGGNPKGGEAGPARTAKKEGPADKSQPLEIIDEIKTSKKKIKPEGPRQKEQIEIIDEFIKAKPSIRKNKPSATPSESADLSGGNLLFTENIISETLVTLLLKQGKKDKAIEVLKKLIWKFPQKKAYFAAQIEELKK